jgi:hypothetical protein
MQSFRILQQVVHIEALGYKAFCLLLRAYKDCCLLGSSPV